MRPMVPEAQTGGGRRAETIRDATMTDPRHRQFGASGRSADAHAARGGPRGGRARHHPRAVHRRGRLDRRPRLRRALHAGRRRGLPCRDAAQAACRDPCARGLRRDQRSRHADPARGGGARRRPRLRHDQHHERLRRRAEAPAGRAGGLDRRERRAGAEEHLRRHQDRGRGPLPIVPSQRGPGVRSCSGPRASFPRRTTIRRRATPYADDNAKANEYLFRRVAIEDVVDAHLARGRARAVDRLRQIHHQRDDAVPAARIARACAPTRPRSSACARRDGKTNMRGAAGACSRASTASTTMRWRAASSAGGRNGISQAVVERLRETGDIRGPLAKQHRRERLPCRTVRGRALSGDGKLR